MGGEGRTRQRAAQDRTLVTRGRILDGATRVLAEAGVPGLTHRAVARAAGVSLAATTYHFDTKAQIVEETSRALLEAYLAAFRRMEARIRTGGETRLASLGDLVRRVVLNAVGRDRTRSLAWCELVLHGGRSAAGRAMAQLWYEQLDSIWHDIARLFDPSASRDRAAAAVDLAIGLTFILHPLGLDQATAADLLAGRQDLEPVLRAGLPANRIERGDDTGPEARRKVLQAAIDIIVEEGATGLSYGRVASLAGMARSGPGYYFPAIRDLLEAAQMALFRRAKARYRDGLAAGDAAGIDENRLLDLTTAIFFREALESGRENIGYHSVWMSAAQDPSLRPAVASSLLDLQRAWSRRIAAVYGAAPSPTVPLRMQAMFTGKLVRATAAAAGLADLSRVRGDFAAVLRDGAGGEAP